MKRLILFAIIALSLAGCGSSDDTYAGETPAETAAAMMLQNYFLQPRSCTSIGGITTCQ